jgi:hypothetical protein
MQSIDLVTTETLPLTIAIVVLLSVALLVVLLVRNKLIGNRELDNQPDPVEQLLEKSHDTMTPEEARLLRNKLADKMLDSGAKSVSEEKKE